MDTQATGGPGTTRMSSDLSSSSVLVSTANEQLAHLIASDLYRRGVRVEVAGDRSTAPCRFSRAVHKFHLTPPPSKAEAYVEAVRNICRSRRIDLFLPSGRDVFLLGPWRDLLYRECRYPFAGERLLEAVNDKAALYRYASHAGLRVPWFTENLAADGGIAPTFPIVSKPLSGFGANGFGLMENRADLERWLAECRAADGFLLQEFVPGPLLVWMGIRQNGRLRASFAFETVRTTPAFGGASVLRRSVINPALDALSTRLLDFLDYEGFCTLDYIHHPISGEDYLIDFNPRFGTSLHAATLADVSFPYCLLKLALGQTFEPPSYEAGVASSSLAGHVGRMVRSCPRKPRMRELLSDAVSAFAHPRSSEEFFSEPVLAALIPAFHMCVGVTRWLKPGNAATVQSNDCRTKTAVAARR